jgi:hypothetical protein
MKEKMAEFLNALMGFRKFIAWTAVLLASIIFLIKGYINGSEWTDLMKTAFTAFVAGNGLEYVATTVKDHLANVRTIITQGKTQDAPPQDSP